MELFQNIKLEQLEEYRQFFKEYQFRAKETVFSPGKFPQSILLVVSGEIRVYLNYPAGKEFTLTILGTGDVYSGHTRAFGEALQAVKVVAIPIDVFKGMLKNIPGLVFSLIGVLGDALTGSMDAIESLVFQEADTRLTNLLLEWAKHGEKTEQGVVINLNYTREQIASMIGSSRQTLASLFKSLTAEGIITIKNKQLVITDLEKLQNHYYIRTGQLLSPI